MRNSSGCDRQDVPIRQRDRQSQGETRGGCLCGKLTRAAWPAPLFRDRRAPLLPEANANQPGSQGCDSQQVTTSAFWSLNQAGTCKSGMVTESQARWKVSPRSLQTLTPTGRNTERSADHLPTLSAGRGGSFVRSPSLFWGLPLISTPSPSPGRRGSRRHPQVRPFVWEVGAPGKTARTSGPGASSHWATSPGLQGSRVPRRARPP